MVFLPSGVVFVRWIFIDRRECRDDDTVQPIIVYDPGDQSWYAAREIQIQGPSRLVFSAMPVKFGDATIRVRLETEAPIERLL